VQDRRLLSFDLAETLARAPEIGQRFVGQKGRQPDVPFGIRRPIPGPPAAAAYPGLTCYLAWQSRLSLASPDFFQYS
jgi:hypothetical protein